MCQLRHTACIILLIAPWMCVIGCVDASKTKPAAVEPTATEAGTKSAASAETAPSAAAAASSPAAKIQVELSSFDQLKERIASFKDRVVVVDAWSTSCLPCMKEFPHLVELARRWPEDVVCISVNLDFAGLPDTTARDGLPKVEQFLQSKSADPANLVNLVSTDTDEQMYAKLEIESIPSIFVYDRAGALAGKLTVDSAGSDGLTYAGDVVPLVEKLIEK